MEIATTWPEPNPPNTGGWVAAIKTCLDAAADRLPMGTDTNALAQFVLTVMEGGVMQSRTHRTLQAFDASVAGLRDYLDRLLAAR